MRRSSRSSRRTRCARGPRPGRARCATGRAGRPRRCARTRPGRWWRPSPKAVRSRGWPPHRRSPSADSELVTQVGRRGGHPHRLLGRPARQHRGHRAQQPRPRQTVTVVRDEDTTRRSRRAGTRHAGLARSRADESERWMSAFNPIPAGGAGAVLHRDDRDMYRDGLVGRIVRLDRIANFPSSFARATCPTRVCLPDPVAFAGRVLRARGEHVHRM